MRLKPDPARDVAQFLTFAAVGVGNTAVDAAVFAGVVAATGWRTGVLAVVASGCGFVAGATHSYVWNSRLTFAATHPGDSPVTVGKFLGVVTVGLAVSSTAFAFAALLLPATTLGLAGAKAVAIAAGLGWNFTMLRGLVFAR